MPNTAYSKGLACLVGAGAVKAKPAGFNFNVLIRPGMLERST